MRAKKVLLAVFFTMLMLSILPVSAFASDDVLEEYDLIVEGGTAYKGGNGTTAEEWDPIDSAPAGTDVRIEADEIEGWEFDHWEVVEGNIDNLIDRYKSFFTMPECDVRIQAYFRAVNGEEITHFHKLTLCFGNSPIAEQQIPDGEKGVEPEDPYQEGKRFLGWYTTDGTRYDFSTPVTEDVRLTAKFEDVCSVLFCFGESPIAEQEVAKGEKATKPDDPFQTGKIFLGWYTADGKKFDFSTTITKNIVLTAKFKLCTKHLWNAGQVITKATTTAPGSKKLTCKTCAKTKTSTIYKASGVKLSNNVYAYNGYVRNPKVIVKDSQGNVIDESNYTFTLPKGRKNVGQYTYVITFKKQYSGTKKLTFKINPKGTSVASLTGASRALNVKWKKQSQKMATNRISGYQIQYSTSKKFTSSNVKTVAGYNSTSIKITGLKAKTTYYVRVRTYRKITVNGETVRLYSGWSGYKYKKTR